MAEILIFGGWGHKSDCLEELVDNSHNVDYLAISSISEIEEKLKNNSYNIVIGWSLGGQIALRLLSNNIIKTRKLILISTPFQFISQGEYNIGIDQQIFTNFKKSLSTDIKKTLKMFYKLNAKNDLYYREIVDYLNNNIPQKPLNLEYWLNQLCDFSCENINWNSIPATKLIYGAKDALVNIKQLDLFTKNLTNHEAFIFNDCGHCPHLHNIKLVKDTI